MHEYGHLLGYDHAQVGVMSEALSVGVGGLWADFPSALSGRGKDQQDLWDANAVDAIFPGGAKPSVRSFASRYFARPSG